MYKTLTILDWDDTLIPTKWIVNKSINLVNDSGYSRYLIFFSKLDIIVHKILTKLMRYGKVVIVTNAVTKWIKLSSRVLPNSRKLIKKSIPIVSAREVYQNTSNDMGIWKQLTFKRLIKEHFSQEAHHVISIGDAEYELNALIKLQNRRVKQVLKSIKMINAPSYENLLNQLELLYSKLDLVLKKEKNMDLEFKTI